MDLVIKIKDLLMRNIDYFGEVSTYVENVLMQSDLKMFLIESLKLLSIIVEADSCKKFSLKHNTDELSIEMLCCLIKNNIPQLPLITPDGYRIQNNRLIVLEVFVRGTPQAYTQKLKEDRVKYDVIRNDLQQLDIELHLVQDGRMSYDVKIIPSWLMLTLKQNIFKLFQYTGEHTLDLEDNEYSRLMSGLSASHTQDPSTSLEGFNFESCEELEEFMRILDLDYSMPEVDICTHLNEVFLYSLERVRNNVSLFKIVDRTEIRDELLNELNKVPIPSSPWTCEPKLEAVLELSTYSSFNSKTNEVKKFNEFLSRVNKIKNAKIINTRKGSLLILDFIVLKFILTEVHNSSINFLSASRCLVGSVFKSVGDRLISVELVNSLPKEKLLKVRKRLIQLLSKDDFIMRLVEPVFEYLTPLTEQDSAVINIIKSGSKPSINYKNTRKIEFIKQSDVDYFEFTKSCGSLKWETVFNSASRISLSIINSMKTSSMPKLKKNCPDDFYGHVFCDECYFQEIDSMNGLYLIYQKPGEKSRTYSICHTQAGELQEVVSFCCAPSRFFLPIFSTETISSLIDEMIGWISFMNGDIVEHLKILLTFLILCIEMSPTKRVQSFLQNIRYFSMAYVNKVYHRDLFEKFELTFFSPIEGLIVGLTGEIIKILLAEEFMLTRKFRFLLNLSYLCHIITKETPDRVTDMIKCFEKFLEPKIVNDYLIIDPQNNKNFRSEMLEMCKRFSSKKIGESRPGFCRTTLSCVVSAFNRQVLDCQKSLKKNPEYPSRSSLVLDLASNKSVVMPKYQDGEILLNYNYDMVLTSVLMRMLEVYKMKWKKNEDRELKIALEDFKKLCEKTKKAKEHPMERFEEFEELSEDVNDILQTASVQLHHASNALNKKQDEVLPELTASFLKEGGLSDSVAKFIMSELHHYDVTDLDLSNVPDDELEKFCQHMKENTPLELSRKLFFPEDRRDFPLLDALKGVTTNYYFDNDWENCFKCILLNLYGNQQAGKYTYNRGGLIRFSQEIKKIRDDMRISQRESNSEAISKRLSTCTFSASALKNVCFYSEASLDTYSLDKPSTGYLKFGLSYKEQVGGNRELYIGDLNTKMYTRVLEDYFEHLITNFDGSCLNDEREFIRGLDSMKANIRRDNMVYSLDHSKWGPFMSPFAFLCLYRNLDLEFEGEKIKKENICVLLFWHLFKIVECPILVVEEYLRGYLRGTIGQNEVKPSTSTQKLYFDHFKSKVIPSHFASVLDMGQGILHNVSDFFGLITEKFINYAVAKIMNIKVQSFTSSDDQVSIIQGSLEPETAQVFCEFHAQLSSLLNKYVSPKSALGAFCGEFKSRFFIFGEEVPLLTKFVSASLHNIKCKEPSGIMNTVDTIVDQSIANGVSVLIGNKILIRTNKVIKYSGFIDDPFIEPIAFDSTDWVKGSHGYRMQRRIEQYFPDECSKLRVLASIFFSKVELEPIIEELVCSLVNCTDTDKNLEYVCRMCESEPFVPCYWLDVTKFGNLRLVLRSKLLSSRTAVTDEKIPNLVKMLQTRLSKVFVKGTQKILTDAINKSAFQSTIASGFVGLCKSMGSACVRNVEGFLYLKELKQGIKDCNCKICVMKVGLYCEKACSSQFRRNVFWDYFTLVLTNTCELGHWVCGVVEQPRLYPNVDYDTYWPVRPAKGVLLEEKASMNQVLFSLKENHRELFDKHILPYVNELKLLKMKWCGKLRFLDLCISLELQNDKLKLTGGLLKGIKEEHYLIKNTDLYNAHHRQQKIERHLPTIPQAIICERFLSELVLKSFEEEILLVLPSYEDSYWYCLINDNFTDDSLSRLGPLSQQIRDHVRFGAEYPLTLSSLSSGHLNPNIEFESGTPLLLDIDGHTKIEDEMELSTIRFIMQLVFSVGNHRMQNRVKTVYTVQVKMTVREARLDHRGTTLTFYCDSGEIERATVSGMVNKTYAPPGVNFIRQMHQIRSGYITLLLDRMEVPDELTDCRVCLCDDEFKKEFVDILSSRYTYTQTGPDYKENIGILKNGWITFNCEPLFKMMGRVNYDELKTHLMSLKKTNVEVFFINLFSQWGSSVLRCIFRKDLIKFSDTISTLFTKGRITLPPKGHFEIKDGLITYKKKVGKCLISSAVGKFTIKGQRFEIFEESHEEELINLDDDE